MLKLGNVYDAGANIGDTVASRYTMPSTVYGIKDLGDGYSSLNPAQGELFFNSAVPAQVSKIKVGIKDDKGYRNEYLENLLEKELQLMETQQTYSLLIQETTVNTLYIKLQAGTI